MKPASPPWCRVGDGGDVAGAVPATKELVKDDGEMVFEDGISRFRPKHSKILKPAVEGTYPR